MNQPVLRFRAYLPLRRSYKPARRRPVRFRPIIRTRPALEFPSACAPEGAFPFGPGV